MKLIPKEVTLKKDTEKEIEKNNIDTETFLTRIKDYLDKANYLINNKMEDLPGMELYRALSEVFNVTVDKEDYLGLLKMMYQKPYAKYVTIYTNMYDNNGLNIKYLVAAPAKWLDMQTLDLNSLRKLTNENDLLVVKTEHVENRVSNKKEKYELHQYLDIDIESKSIDEESELFPYFIDYLKNSISIKNILYDLKLYVDEVIYQTRCITGLMFSEDERLAKIGKEYKKAYDNATNNGLLPKKEKVSVHHHKKVKKAK